MCTCRGEGFAFSLQILSSAQDPNELNFENSLPTGQKQYVTVLLDTAPHL